MPVVPAHEGEGMDFSDGETLVSGKNTGNHKWFVGMYGPLEMIFEVKKEGAWLFGTKKWKVVPRDYLTVIGLSEQVGSSE